MACPELPEIVGKLLQGGETSRLWWRAMPLARSSARNIALRKDPNLTFGVPGRIFKTEEEMDEYYEELEAKDALKRAERELRENA